MNRYRRRHERHGGGLFCQRIFSLLSVNQADRCSQFCLHEMLKTRHMLARRIGIALTLQGLRQSKFRGSVKRIQVQCILKCRYCLRIFLKLGEQESEKVLRVGIVLSILATC